MPQPGAARRPCAAVRSGICQGAVAYTWRGGGVPLGAPRGTPLWWSASACALCALWQLSLRLQGHAWRRASRGRATVRIRPWSTRCHRARLREWGEGPARPGELGGSSGHLPSPGRRKAAPYGRKPTGRGTAAGQPPRTRSRAVPAVTPPRW